MNDFEGLRSNPFRPSAPIFDEDEHDRRIKGRSFDAFENVFAAQNENPSRGAGSKRVGDDADVPGFDFETVFGGAGSRGVDCGAKLADAPVFDDDGDRFERVKGINSWNSDDHDGVAGNGNTGFDFDNLVPGFDANSSNRNISDESGPMKLHVNRRAIDGFRNPFDDLESTSGKAPASSSFTAPDYGLPGEVSFPSSQQKKSNPFDDIWLTVSEIPLFTEPTSAPPPSRPPPPRPVKARQVDKIGRSTESSRKNASEISNFSDSPEVFLTSESWLGTTGSNIVSQTDTLENFDVGMNATHTTSDGQYFHEDLGTHLNASAFAGTMREAINIAEDKVRHANELKEREYAKAFGSRDAPSENDDRVILDAQERTRREQEEISESREPNAFKEKEEELRKVVLERKKAEELELEKEENERHEREIERMRLRDLENENARQAVQRATQEARGRAAAEARVRADRAAVEKANREARERAERAAVQRTLAQVRERAAAEAKERAEKAAAEAKERTARAEAEVRLREERAVADAREREKAEAKERARRAQEEARIKAERAAVQRATAEARERAAAEARERVVAEARRRAATAARMDEQKIEDDFESYFGAGAQPTSAPKNRSFNPESPARQQTNHFRTSSVGNPPNTWKSPSHTNSVDDLSSIFGASSQPREFQEVGEENEERRRARLEREQRSQYRVAKVLAEKNERDLQSRREQEERHRLSETLDFEIKRWAAGKEKNLRALLATMQYVLWPECGWQPVSLTDLITAAAVKKAYRKATLCIHPDKVQQKGANLQQKYIAEKVFDLLKEAWNKFNSEELF